MLMPLTLATLLATACPTQTRGLEAAADAVERTYFDAGIAGQIATRLRQWADESRYADACADEARFLDALNRDLDGYDGHFHVETRHGSGSDDWLTQWRASARRSNVGVREVSVLDGNIGYLRFTTFHDWAQAGDKLTAAFDLLADTDALVLDLRQNGGGDSDTADHLVRAFVDADVDGVQSIQTRSGITPTRLPREGLRRYGKPLAILVDRRTGSAAEFVAYSLQALGRARIIGTRTGGAANMVDDPVVLTEDLQISIPNARPVNDTTHRNWEGSGVTPDLPGGDDPLFVARQALMQAPADTPCR